MLARFTDSMPTSALPRYREIPVVSDKPIAASWKQFHALAERWANRVRPLLTEFPTRWDSAYDAAQHAIASGQLGEVALVHACEAIASARDPSGTPIAARSADCSSGLARTKSISCASSPACRSRRSSPRGMEISRIRNSARWKTTPRASCPLRTAPTQPSRSIISAPRPLQRTARSSFASPGQRERSKSAPDHACSRRPPKAPTKSHPPQMPGDVPRRNPRRCAGQTIGSLRHIAFAGDGGVDAADSRCGRWSVNV